MTLRLHLVKKMMLKLSSKNVKKLNKNQGCATATSGLAQRRQ
jgi:hypothetical protein